MISSQNVDDNECFKWCLVRYLNSTNHHSARIRKANKNFEKRLDFKGIRFPIKTRDIHKIEKKKEFFWHYRFRLSKQSKISSLYIKKLCNYVNKPLRCLKNINMLSSKILKEK